MRHQDPRTTTEFYGHLQSNYLKKEIERLSFRPAPAEEATAPPHPAEEPRLSLGGRCPGAAASRRHARTRALRLHLLLEIAPGIVRDLWHEWLIDLDEGDMNRRKAAQD